MNDIPRTGLDAGSAARTFLRIDVRQALFHPDRTLRAGPLAFLTADTAGLAGCHDGFSFFP